MGWWRTGNNDDIVGDVPADGITTGLRELAESLEAKGKQKPSWQELLAAIDLAVRGREAEMLDGDPKEAESQAGDARRYGENDIPPEVLETVRSLVEDTARAYEQHVGRKPRITEIIESFKFVCGDDTEQYLRDKSIK